MNDAAPIAPPNPNPNQRDSFRTVAARWTLTATVFLTFYLGTVGPMAALHQSLKFKPLQKLIEIVYFPVVLAMKHEIEPLHTMMRWYVGLFR